jgi:multiple sugar transport system permease protein
MSHVVASESQSRHVPHWRTRDGRQELLMLLPALVLLITFIIVPFVMSVLLSVTNQRLLPGPIPAKFVGARNFIRILTDDAFWQAFGNVIKFTLMVIPVQCGLALLLADLLNRQQKLKGVLRGLFFMPYITPMVIVTLLWATLLKYPEGVLNSILGWITRGWFQPVNWLGEPHTAMFSIVLLSAWQAYGFQMIVYLAGLQNIPLELYEAAGIDGASGWQKFWHVTWPGLLQTNIFVLTVTTIQALKLFTQVNILTNGGPRGVTNTLVHYIYEAGFIAQNIGYASAASLALLVLISGIVVFQQIIIKRFEA